MTEPKIDAAVLNTIASGGAILFLGAGFALGGRTESGERDRRGLKEALISEFRASLSDPTLNLASLSLEEVAHYLQARKDISRRAIAETLCRFLMSSDELQKLETFALLRTLIAAAPRLFEAIVTTNWDHGIEQSLRGLDNVRTEPFVLDDDLLEYDATRLSILKIHGDVGRPETIVLGAQDFDLYERTHPRTVERLRILFSTKYLVLIGYSGKDENFRRLYRGLNADLAGRIRGGCIVSPALDNRDRLWAPSVKLAAIEATAQEFLESVLTVVATTTYGSSPRFRGSNRRSTVRLSDDSRLSSIARRLKRAYELRDVWVTRLRPEQRPNRAIGSVAAIYVAEKCGASARSLSLAVGETMDAFVEALEPSAFAEPLLITPTVVLLAGPKSFNDPTHLAQRLVGRFPAGRAQGVPLRLPDERLLRTLLPALSARKRAELHRGLRLIAQGLLDRATAADVIIGSVRPPDWFGGGGPPQGRTIPLQHLVDVDFSRASAKFARIGVAAIHHMMLLSRSGDELSDSLADDTALQAMAKMVCRPSSTQLRKATRGGQTVILAVAGSQKMEAAFSVLTAGLCNTLVVDESLGDALITHSTSR